MHYAKNTSQVAGVSTTQPTLASEWGRVKNYVQKTSPSTTVTTAPLFLHDSQGT